MTSEHQAKRKALGTFTAEQVGDALKITIPTSANIKPGTLLVAYLEPDGSLVYQPKPEKQLNFWDSDFVQNHNFAADQAIIGELQGHRVGREVSGGKMT